MAYHLHLVARCCFGTQDTFMKAKLTKRYVDSLSFSDKTEYHQDTELAGFAVCVGKKTKRYMVNKRINNKLHRVAISDASLMTITEAREEAIRIMSAIMQGEDPSAKKKQTLEQGPDIPTLGECFDYFKEHKTLSDETLKSYNRQVLTLLGDWVDIPLNNITKSMIVTKHQKLSKTSKAQANAAMRVLRSVWNYCRQSFLDDNEDPIIKEHPVAILNAKKDWNVIKPRTRHVAEEELGKYLKVAINFQDRSSHKQEPHSNNARDIQILFLLTGVRLNEAQPLRWKDVDLKAGKIELKNTKNGSNYTFPMGDILWSLMRRRARFRQGGEWVFPSSQVKSDSHVKNMTQAYKNLSSEAGLYITPHDLRRTFISVANGLQMNYPVLKKLLNHRESQSSDDVTLQYIQISQRQLREALNDIEQRCCQHAGMTQEEVIEKLNKDY